MKANVNKERIVIVGNGGAHVYVTQKIAQVQDDAAVIYETVVRDGQLRVRVVQPQHPATKE
jgi:hypothetical protein